MLRGSGLPEGAVALAERQTAGRGRSGRRWVDHAGKAILVSLILRPDRPTGLPQASLAMGLAAAEAIETVTGLAALVKWPNDVIVGDHKVAGVLLEADADAVVCGIGINVNQEARELPSGTKVSAGSLALAASRSFDRAPLLGALLGQLERRYDDWRANGLEAIGPALESRNWLRGRAVECTRGRGVAGMIGEDGRLEVCLDAGSTVAIDSDEVVPL